MNLGGQLSGWLQVGVVVFSIFGAAYHMGKIVAQLNNELQLLRIDMSTLFRKLDFDQPSRAAERGDKH